MVAYSFQKRFVAPIRADTKLQTIRAEGRRRHARPGEDLQLYTGMRTRDCELIARRRCRSVHPIIIGLAQERIFVGADCPHADILQPDTHSLRWTDGRPMPMREANVEQVATADGFAGWPDMLAFWRIEHSDAFENETLWYGVLVMWLPYDLVSLDAAIGASGIRSDLDRMGLR